MGLPLPGERRKGILERGVWGELSAGGRYGVSWRRASVPEGPAQYNIKLKVNGAKER